MTRLGAFVATCALVLLGVARLAHADPRADQLAKEASDAMFLDPPRYDVAIDKYRQAIVLSPEGRFYLNLCVAYYQIGEFGLALQSCDAVKTAGADATTMENTAKVTAKVEGKIRELGKDPNDIRNPPPPDTTGGGTTGTGGTGTGGGGGGDVTGGGGAAGGTGPVDTSQFRGAPQPSLYTAKPPTHDYTWSVGGELYGFGGQVGAADYYGSSGAGLRLHADYIVVPQRRIGVSGFLGFNGVGADENAASGENLTIIDIGAAAFAHLGCSGRFCFTPLAGLMISGMQPESTGEQVAFTALGIRLEGGLSYALGTKFEHVVTAALGANIYSKSFGDYDGMTADYYGLDTPGRTIYFGVGYTHRFDTPFGQAPFITIR